MQAGLLFTAFFTQDGSKIFTSGAVLMRKGPNERKNSWAEDRTQI